jgi:hypothetical protein
MGPKDPLPYVIEVNWTEGQTGADDLCPDIPGDPSFDGCPGWEPIEDSDGDGVSNVEDPCPDLPGSIENNGCPEGRDEEAFSTFRNARSRLNNTIQPHAWTTAGNACIARGFMPI